MGRFSSARRRAALVIAGAGLGLGWVAVVPPAATAAPPSAECATDTVRQDEKAARASALLCGKRVEVAAARTAKSQTFANPNGTMTYEASATPKRVKTAGGWTPIDTTLRAAKTGGYAATTTLPMTFAKGGGSEPFATVQTSAGAFSLRWPTALPAARLDGDTVVYPDVYDGVDLRVRAFADSFNYVLVVKTRAAAANPALRRIAVAVTGPATRSRADGTFEVLDDTGAAVLASAPAGMWDASNGGTARGAEDLTRTGKVASELTGGELVLRPDPAWLADESLTLPLYVDPQIGMPRTSFAYANIDNYDYSGGVGDVARVGRNPECCGTSWRAYFAFGLSQVHGKQIIAAELKTIVTHSWNCTGTDLTLAQSGAIQAGINGGRIGWAPGVLTSFGARSAQSCSAPGNNPSWILTSQMQGWADARFNDYTFVFLGSESDSQQWKKLSAANTNLVVQYNTPPTVSDQTATGDGSTVGCYTSGTTGQPAIGSHNGVQLSTKVQDAENDQNIVGKFEWQDLTTGGAVVTVPDSPGLPAPRTITVNVPAASMPNGHDIQWRVRAWDGAHHSAYSPWCHFVVDGTAPAQPLLTSADLKDFPLPAGPGAVVGAPATVTFSPVDQTLDRVVGYYYSVATVDKTPYIWVPANSSGVATAPVVPVDGAGGINILSVVAVDASGNRSPQAPNVGNFHAPGLWMFFANGGTPAKKRADATGDDNADIVAVVDPGGYRTSLMRWTTKPDGSGTTSPVTSVVNDPNAYPMASVKSLNGDFNGDGRADVAMFRDHGNCRTTLSWWLSDGNGYRAAAQLWDSGNGGWCYDRTLAVAGDFTGDGKTDIAAFYRYDNAQERGFVFEAKSDGSGFSWPVPYWDSGVGNWDGNRIKATAAGDFDKDGKAEVLLYYDYGNCDTGLWRFRPPGNSTFATNPIWRSGAGARCMTNTVTVFTGDADGDGDEDLYEILKNGSGVCAAISTGQAFTPASCMAIPGLATAPAWRFTGGDIDGNGRCDIVSFDGTTSTSIKVVTGGFVAGDSKTEWNWWNSTRVAGTLDPTTVRAL
ncbi:FG-GAP repeat domain-containing protein [Dactylosporangium sp. NPDC000521]|uniref:FG-GAP repeat domain-containing protein n=1 Tax=Dactylosporangium sp. NPDC000521 TaxID=3363975 RepID=UPI003688CD11